MKTGWGDIEQPPFEDTVDVLSDPIDWAGTREQWRTPGINPNADVPESGKENIGIGQRVWNWTLPGMAMRGGRIIEDAVGEEVRERTVEPIADFFMRAAFILVGTIFVVFGMILISRPARAGIIEGVAEAVVE